jgi:hypothetical protein
MARAFSLTATEYPSDLVRLLVYGCIGSLRQSTASKRARLLGARGSRANMWGVFLFPAFFVVVWILLCILAMRMAQRKGRRGATYFLVSYFLTPVVGLLMAAIAKPRLAARNQRRCPYCAKLVKGEAKGCRFCGKHLPEVESSPPQWGGQGFESRAEYEAWRVAIAKPDPTKADQLRPAAGDQRRCPFCAELVKREARGCRFCGKHLPEV